MPETPDHLTITRRSDVTGAIHTLVLPMTNLQLLTWGTGTPLTEAAPQLNAAQRRFLETGVTPEEDAALATLE